MSWQNSKNLEALRDDIGSLLETGLFADARLICYEKSGGNGERKQVEIPVHRAILTSRSQFFSDEFNTWRDVIEFPEERSAEDIRAVIAQIYSNYKCSQTEAELIQLYKDDELYGLDIFEKQQIRSEIVIDNFPIKRQQGAMIFPGDEDEFASWEVKMKIKVRKEGQQQSANEQKGKRGKKQMHMDLKFQTYGQCLVSDLSLSILNDDDEKLKNVKREGIFGGTNKNMHPIARALSDGFFGGTIVWEDCLDYNQIVNGDFLRYEEFDETAKRNKRQQSDISLFLRVLFEATFIHPKESDSLEAMSLQYGKLLESGRFSDATIIFHNDLKGENVVTIPVHKCVLAARSKFFMTAFSIDMREAKTGKVVVRPESGFSLDTIRAMLQFIYTARLPPRMDSEERDGTDEAALIELFKAAHFYQIQGLTSACVAVFPLTVERCFEMVLLANSQACDLLLEKTLFFIRDNAESVLLSEGWRQLMESDDNKDVKALLSHWLGETPVSVDNFTELLTIYDRYKNKDWKGKLHGNWELIRRALYFIMENEEAIRESDGWRQLMDDEDDPMTLYADCLWELPLTLETCMDGFRLGHAFGDEEFRELALKVIVDNVREVEETEGWRRYMATGTVESQRFRDDVLPFLQKEYAKKNRK